MRKIIIGLLLLLSVGASAQWQQTGSKVRYVNGLGIPTKDTAAGVSADSSQIVIRPADSSLYVKYKRTWIRVGGGGGSIGGTGTINYVPKFTASGFIGNSLIYDNGTAVGINTLTPTTTLQVGNGTGNPEITASGLNYDVVLGTPSGSALGFTTVGNYVGVYSNSSTKDLAFTHGNSRAITFGTANQTRLTITASGRLLANTRTDNGVDALQVNGSGMFNQSINASQRLSLTNTNTGTSAESFLFANTTGNRYLGLLQHGQNKTGTTAGLSNASLSEIQAGGDNTALLINQGSATAPMAFATNSVERVRITSAGRILMNTTTDNGVDALQVNGSLISTQFKLSALNTAPATASSTGTLGEIRIDANYIYICTATNTWKRVAIATW
jgi:hypothetical protein